MKSLEKIRKAKEEAKRLLAQARKDAGEIFKTEYKHIFENHPKLESFSWSQFTPFFNDGNTCLFRVYNEELTIKYDGRTHEEVGSYSLNSAAEHLQKNDCYDNDHKIFCEAVVNGGLGDAMKEIFALLESLDDEDYESLFGDHAIVTVTKNKIMTDEYNDHH